jgi:hypothetical protein
MESKLYDQYIAVQIKLIITSNVCNIPFHKKFTSSILIDSNLLNLYSDLLSRGILNQEPFLLYLYQRPTSAKPVILILFPFHPINIDLLYLLITTMTITTCLQSTTFGSRYLRLESIVLTELS